MRNIAIIEDEDSAAEVLLSGLNRYSAETGEKFNIIRFKNAVDFLDDYKPIYAVVFMDIQMPGMNGMDAAFKLRGVDKLVSLIFITNLVQYAQKGYEVDAISYLIKPVSYYDLSLKLKKALELYAATECRNVMIDIAGGVYNLSCDKLMYVEVIKHKLHYHLVDDVITTTGVLSEVEKKLEPYGFLRCNSCYIVNPKFIISVKGTTVKVGTEELAISRPRRAIFLEKLTEWFAANASGGGLK